MWALPPGIGSAVPVSALTPPDYNGGSIVNLAASMLDAFGVTPPNPVCRHLPADMLPGDGGVLFTGSTDFVAGLGQLHLQSRHGSLEFPFVYRPLPVGPHQVGARRSRRSGRTAVDSGSPPRLVRIRHRQGGARWRIEVRGTEFAHRLDARCAHRSRTAHRPGRRSQTIQVSTTLQLGRLGQNPGSNRVTIGVVGRGRTRLSLGRAVRTGSIGLSNQGRGAEGR